MSIHYRVTVLYCAKNIPPLKVSARECLHLVVIDWLLGPVKPYEHPGGWIKYDFFPTSYAGRLLKFIGKPASGLIFKLARRWYHIYRTACDRYLEDAAKQDAAELNVVIQRELDTNVRI